VVGDWPGVERLQDVEGRAGIADHRLAHVLQCEPDLLAVRCCSDVGAEGARLLDVRDDLVVGD
jgi:hypothetical protein